MILEEIRWFWIHWCLMSPISGVLMFLAPIWNTSICFLGRGKHRYILYNHLRGFYKVKLDNKDQPLATSAWSQYAQQTRLGIINALATTHKWVKCPTSFIWKNTHTTLCCNLFSKTYWIQLCNTYHLKRTHLYHVQPYPTRFEPAAGYRSWPMASNLHCGHLPVGLCHGQG